MDEKLYLLGSKAQGPASWDEETQEKKDGQLKSIGGAGKKKQDTCPLVIFPRKP
jgi:hypothetical protein